MQDEFDAATAGDAHANDDYTGTGPDVGPPPPPQTFPAALAAPAETTPAEPTEETTALAEPDTGGSGTDENADGVISVDEANRDQLEAAVIEHDLDVKGTGADGYVTVSDFKSALADAGVTEIAKAP